MKQIAPSLRFCQRHKPNLQSNLFRNLLRKDLDEIMSELSERERMVIKLRFGLWMIVREPLKKLGGL